MMKQRRPKKLSHGLPRCLAAVLALALAMPLTASAAGGLFDKAYDPQGGTGLDPTTVMILVSIVSAVYFLVALGTMVMEDGAIFYFEKYIFPVQTFYLLGCCIGQSGYGCMMGVVDGGNDGPDKIKYTLSNIKDWDLAKYLLIGAVISLVFILVVQILLHGRFDLFLRDVGMMAALFAFGFCMGRFAVTVEGFLLKLLFLPASLLAFLCQITWLFSAVLWLIPTGAIAAMNRQREEKEREQLRRPAEQSGSDAEGQSEENASLRGFAFPTYLTIGSERYRLEYSEGEKAEYYCSRTGERRTVWKYDLVTE